MKLIVLTGACGSGKTTVNEALAGLLPPERFICADADRLGFRWSDYAGTERAYEFHNDLLRELVRRADGRDAVFSTCMTPQDYFTQHIAPPDVSSTLFIALYASDDDIERRLCARPAEWGFATAEARQPHLEYNRWVYKNRGKYPLSLNTAERDPQRTAELIRDFILKQ